MPGFTRERFVYDAEADRYHCPGGAELRLRQEVRGQRRYMTPACRTCAIKAQCTSRQYRQVTRHRHEVALAYSGERERSYRLNVNTFFLNASPTGVCTPGVHVQSIS